MKWKYRVDHRTNIYETLCTADNNLFKDTCNPILTDCYNITQWCTVIFL